MSIVVLDGSSDVGRDQLGGKAWSIQRMLALGIAAPPAFVLTTEVCRRYGAELPEEIWERVPDGMRRLEALTGRVFGGAERPLLVSVRSGAAVSMPGMMDTILNLGVTGAAALASDTRRRFADQFARVVGVPAPPDPWEQLRCAITAVLASWNSRRARDYRAGRGISDAGGTAVTVQAMVFGNHDADSGTGVLFTRDPLSGAPEPYGEWLPRGQGEDVVSGRADALPLVALAASMPAVHADLLAAAARLERDGRDVQDIEFTVESGRLWLLQSRTAKRTPHAALRHAVQLAREGVIGVGEALDRITPDHLAAMMTPRVEGGARLTSGKPASPGVGVGVVVTDPDEALARAEAGEAVVLARPTTEPDDVTAMSVAVAVLTELGGSTSHAAVVCRELDVPCVVGCGAGTLGALAGRTVTVDAAAGVVYDGALAIVTTTAGNDPDVGWLCAQLGDGDPAALLAKRRPGHEV